MIGGLRAPFVAWGLAVLGLVAACQRTPGATGDVAAGSPSSSPTVGSTPSSDCPVEPYWDGERCVGGPVEPRCTPPGLPWRSDLSTGVRCTQQADCGEDEYCRWGEDPEDPTQSDFFCASSLETMIVCVEEVWYQGRRIMYGSGQPRLECDWHSELFYPGTWYGDADHLFARLVPDTCHPRWYECEEWTVMAFSGGFGWLELGDSRPYPGGTMVRRFTRFEGRRPESYSLAEVLGFMNTGCIEATTTGEEGDEFKATAWVSLWGPEVP